MNPSQVSAGIIDFTRYLRDQGYSIGIAEITDGMQALGELPHPDKVVTERVLRSLFCRNQQEWSHFHELFSDYWQIEQAPESSVELRYETPRLKQIAGKVAGLAGTSTDHFKNMDQQGNGVGAGKQKTISKADFRFLKDPQAMRQAEQLAERLALLLKKRYRRRKKVVRQGRCIDVRHTLRANMSYGGTPLSPRYSIRTREPPELVILHDVSHSMSWNNPVLFRFVRGLVRTFPKTEAFVFHTLLYHVTQLYRERSTEVMRQKLESKNNLWLGGTCIAESLASFNQDHARTLLNSKTIVMLISDGFDTDAPEALASQLKTIKRRCNRVLWLNPMLGRDGYQPDNDSYRASKPYVDAFAPAHSLEALRQVLTSLR